MHCRCLESLLNIPVVQAMIDEPSKQWREGELPVITSQSVNRSERLCSYYMSVDGFTASQISWAVNTLNKVSCSSILYPVYM